MRADGSTGNGAGAGSGNGDGGGGGGPLLLVTLPMPLEGLHLDPMKKFPGKDWLWLYWGWRPDGPVVSAGSRPDTRPTRPSGEGRAGLATGRRAPWSSCSGGPRRGTVTPEGRERCCPRMGHRGAPAPCAQRVETWAPPCAARFARVRA